MSIYQFVDVKIITKSGFVSRRHGSNTDPPTLPTNLKCPRSLINSILNHAVPCAYSIQCTSIMYECVMYAATLWKSPNLSRFLANDHTITIFESLLVSRGERSVCTRNAWTYYLYTWILCRLARGRFTDRRKVRLKFEQTKPRAVGNRLFSIRESF